MDLFKTLKNLLFIDIETVGVAPVFDQLDDRLKPLWEIKARRWDPQASAAQLFEDKSALLPEFGRIVAVGAGYFHAGDGKLPFLRVKAFSGDDEKALLLEFKSLVDEKFHPSALRLVAHNGKDFDFPFLCRRMLINGIKLPQALDIYGKKPWEIPHIDTMDMWRFGDLRTYVSLELLAALFGIGHVKQGMDGSMVHDTYWNKKEGLAKIASYCIDDVTATARLYLKMKVLPDIPDENIIRL